MIGRSLRRLEDPHLVRGEGRYAADIPKTGAAHLAIVRSPLPHARIHSIDKSAAEAIPGVLAVWTADDLPEGARKLGDRAPRGVPDLPRPVLADGETCCVGEPLAAVFAEDGYAAADAVQAVFADLEPLPAAGGIAAATAPGAPPAHTSLDSNVQGTRPIGYGDVDSAFASDSVVAKATLSLARICGAAMEPRAYTAEWDAEAERLRLWSSTQFVFGVRGQVAGALGIADDQVAVLAEDVGGGFGPKGQVYPEEILVALGARALGRPVRFVATRSEDTATTVHGHGVRLDLELAAAPDGTFRGLRGRVLQEVGSASGAGTGQPSIITAHMLSTYRLPAMAIEGSLVFTNAAATGFVRGGGRPAGNFAMERMVDRLAVQLGRDPADLRRQNLIRADEMPYDTGYPAGRDSTVVYDGGDYPRLLETALDAQGYEGLRSRGGRTEDGRLLGVGIACCSESSGFGGNEPARVRLDRDGTAHLYVGSTPQGQSHLTTAMQVLAERLGWPPEHIRVTAGDTTQVPFALLTAGSRTAVQVGNAVAQAATAVRRTLLERAAEVLEADPVDLVMEDGRISVRGAPQSAIPVTDAIPEDGLEVLEVFNPDRPNAYSSGCHAAAVAVDPETGAIDILRYVIVHDTGRAINPMVVEGQIQGGWVHGLGYALFEEAVYQDDGNFMSSTFLDYSIAGPPEVGVPVVDHIETPTDANPEGIKGAGESGTIPVPACIANAVEDAIRQVRPDAVVDSLPLSPLTIRRLLA